MVICSPRVFSLTSFNKMALIFAAKATTRAQIAEALAKLTPEENEAQSRTVFEKLVSEPAYKNAKNISTYLSIANEIDTEPIVRRAFEDGKQIFVPRYNKKGMEMVQLKSMQDWETLPVTSWGIKQPSFKDNRPNALDCGLDLIVCPGVGFTAKGHRMGHGGGYYDRFLRHIKETQKKPPALIAVALKEQILPEIPITDQDIVMDLVLFAD